jgi:hypothetical protein
MTKTFCDRCGILIRDNYKDGADTHIEDGYRPWIIELTIKRAGDWKLCNDCADELIKVACAQMTAKKSKRSA